MENEKKKDIKNFRTMNCEGCQCNNCYDCQSSNCDVCYRTEFASEDCDDMYCDATDKKNCDLEL